MVAGLPPPALRRIINAHWARPGLPGHMCPSTAPALAPHRCTGSHSTPASPAWCGGGLCRVGGVQCGAAARQLEWILVPLLNQCCHTPYHCPETACLPPDCLSTHASTTSPAPLTVRVSAATNAVRLWGGSATTLCTGCSREGNRWAQGRVQGAAVQLADGSASGASSNEMQGHLH